jgi:hypothetical protein
MTFFIAFIIVTTICCFGMWRLVRVHHTRIAGLDDLAGQTRPIDLQAFQNLTDPAQTEFLRRKLSRRDFITVQRQRNLAAVEYVRRIALNASILAQLGSAALSNPDPEVARAAQAMINSALRVRVLATMAMFKLYLESTLPGYTVSAAGVFADYRRLTESATLFTRVQRPAFAGRLHAML